MKADNETIDFVDQIMQTATVLSYDKSKSIDTNLQEYLRMKKNRDECNYENFLSHDSIDDYSVSMFN